MYLSLGQRDTMECNSTPHVPHSQWMDSVILLETVGGTLLLAMHK